MAKKKYSPAKKNNGADQHTEKATLFALEPRIMLDAAGVVTVTEGFVDSAEPTDSSGGDARALQEQLQAEAQTLHEALLTGAEAEDIPNGTQHTDANPSLVVATQSGDSNSHTPLTKATSQGASFDQLATTNLNPGTAELVSTGSIDFGPDLHSGEHVFIDPVSGDVVFQVNETPFMDGAVSTTASEEIGALYVIDTSINGYEAIVDSLPDDALIVFVDANDNGLDAIQSALENHGPVSGLHIFSHGESGSFDLGSVTLDLASITETHADQLESIGSFLTDSADIFIYGCNFAADAEGIETALALAEITGADIAASTDLTGHETLGGDWTLEFTTGTVDTNSIVSADAFLGVLESPVPLSFDGATLISGVDGQIGAIYEFQNVTPGVDAHVEITGIVNGASLATIDRAASGANTGFTEAFQPEVTITGGSPGNPVESYIEFQISFFQTGTSNAVDVTFNASPIDVDGNSVNNREFFEIQGATLQTLEGNPATQLSTSFDSSTGFSRIEASTVAVSSGINPNATQFAAQTQLTNVSEFSVRVGGISEGAAQTRLTSLYFDEINFNTPDTTRIGNTAPDAADDALMTMFDGSISGSVLADNDFGADRDAEGDQFNVTAVNGQTASVGSQITLPSGALLTLNADGTYTYDPNGQFDSLSAGQTTTDSFTYTITDTVTVAPGVSIDPSVTSQSDTATVTITILGPGNAEPNARNDDFITPKNGAHTWQCHFRFWSTRH